MSKVQPEVITIDLLKQECKMLDLIQMKSTGSDSFILVNQTFDSQLSSIFNTSGTFNDILVRETESSQE